MAARKAVRIATTKSDQTRNPYAQPTTSKGAVKTTMEKKKQTEFELYGVSVFDPKKKNESWKRVWETQEKDSFCLFSEQIKKLLQRTNISITHAVALFLTAAFNEYVLR